MENKSSNKYGISINKAMNTIEFSDILEETLLEIKDEYQLENTDNNNNNDKNNECELLITTRKPDNLIVKNIEKYFTFEKEIGNGVSCKVFLSRNRKTGKPYALKEMAKQKPGNRTLFKNENRSMRQLLNHPNIAKLYGAYKTKNAYYIATEFCSGETLLQKILAFDGAYFCEEKAVSLMKNLLSAVNYMHSHSIVHRDLKCQNLVFENDGPDSEIKIIDFGNAEIISNENEKDNLFVGTMHYISPEMCRARITKKSNHKKVLYKSDMWSLGVVCYIICCGRIPFFGQSEEDIMNSILECNFEWPQHVKLSSPCKDFINSLMCVDLEKRLTAEQALDHDWIVNCDEYLVPSPHGIDGKTDEPYYPNFDDLDEVLDHICLESYE